MKCKSQESIMLNVQIHSSLLTLYLIAYVMHIRSIISPQDIRESVLTVPFAL